MPENITHDDAQYALDIVKTICAQVGPGSPGTPQELRRAAMIQKELESHLGARNVVVEGFTVAPRAFLGSLPLGAVLLLLAAVLNLSIPRWTGIAAWVAGVAALTCSVVSALSLIFEFILYREWIDPFFKKKRSVNVIGTLRRPDAQDVRRLLILSGHHDSAPENTWIGSLGYGLYVTLPTIFLALLTMIVLSIIQLAGVIFGQPDAIRFGTLGWILLAYPILPAIIVGLFFNRGSKGGGTVPGAADNLSACAVAVAMCRFLAQNPDYIPADTELRFISFGCEEAGLRGSRRYVERHIDELKRLDARLLNYEVIAHPEIGIMTSDVAGVKHSPEMVNSVIAAAERAGVPHKVKPNPTGSGRSDAGSFSQAGLKAITLLPFHVPQQVVAFYHQKKDTPDVLTIEPLFNVLKLSFEWIRSGGE